MANGVLYVGSLHHKLYAFHASTGSEIWAADAGSTILAGPAVANGVVYVGTAADRLLALDATTGSRIWTARTQSAIGSSPAVANGVVYVASWHDGTLHAFDASSGEELWSMITADSMTSSPAVVNGMVYVGGWDHNLYAFALPSGIARVRAPSHAVMPWFGRVRLAQAQVRIEAMTPAPVAGCRWEPSPS